MFGRTANYPVESNTVLLSEIVSFIERSDDRRYIVAIVEGTVASRMRDRGV